MNYPYAHNSLSRLSLRIFATQNSGANPSFDRLLTAMSNHKQSKANCVLHTDALPTGKYNILSKQNNY